MAGESLKRLEELKKRLEEQARALDSLASSVEGGGGGLGELMRRVEKPCEALGGLASEASVSESLSGVGVRVEKPKFVLVWPETRELFLQYLEFKRYEPANARNMLSYLDRFVRAPIAAPLDVMRIFSPLSVGQRHHLNRAMRAWFKCLEINSPSREFREFLNDLRRAIPKDEVGIDVHVPEEEQIISDLRRIKYEPIEFQAAYNLLLDSGLRVVEVERLLNNFPEAERLRGFYRCPVGFFRGTKQAYYCYLTEYTFQLIKRCTRPVNRLLISKWFQNHDYTRAKYLRKFANDIMTSERLNIPESVADFIQGRVPKSIGAKHYMKLKRKADQFYPRYAQYITDLRKKAGVLRV
ncbi:MAG: integrase [Candidatus Bathyarchaeia archaeon]